MRFSVIHRPRPVGQSPTARTVLPKSIIGRRATAQLHPLIQAKLRIGAPNDRYEQEADRVADQIMRMPDTTSMESTLTSHNGSETVQRKCAACAAGGTCPRCEEELRRQPMEEEDELQAKHRPGNRPTMTPRVQAQIHSMRAGGQPLDTATRVFMERRFGRSFENVRVHTDARADKTAEAINARAYTLGKHIFFSGGQYSPGTVTGRTLIAHELAHTVQQAATTGRNTVQRECREGEGPPVVEGPVPGEDGPHPLIYRGVSTRRSRRPAVGDAQQLLNRFLERLDSGEFVCGEGADLEAINRLRDGLEQDPLDVDCRFGPNTEIVTRMFQRCVFPNQPDQWDGRIGKNTWPELDRLRASGGGGGGTPALPPVVKPGPRTPCERECHFDFLDCISRSSNPMSCLAQRSACLTGCVGAPPVFEVCARLLQPPVEVSGCNHAYVETPTKRYAIITPCTSQLSFASPSGGVAIKTDRSPDPCGRRPTCIECVPRPGVTDLESCFEAQFTAYAAPSLHKILGPNSNTFAGTLARACCVNMNPQPPAFGCLPGWDDPPAPPRAADCPSGPPVC